MRIVGLLAWVIIKAYDLLQGAARHDPVVKR